MPFHNKTISFYCTNKGEQHATEFYNTTMMENEATHSYKVRGYSKYKNIQYSAIKSLIVPNHIGIKMLLFIVGDQDWYLSNS